MYSKGSLEEHIVYIKKVLQKLKEYRLYLQPRKYEFYIKEIGFLRFIILNQGVKINLKKVEAV